MAICRGIGFDTGCAETFRAGASLAGLKSQSVCPPKVFSFVRVNRRNFELTLAGRWKMTSISRIWKAYPVLR